VDTQLDLERVIRSDAGRLVARLARVVDFDTAEDAVAEAVADAWATWPRTGVPRNPTGWLATAAHRNAIDRLRTQQRTQRLLDRLGADPTWAAGQVDPADEPVWPETPPGTSRPTDSPAPAMGSRRAAAPPDERIPMLFAACHPALPVESRLPLTLRAVVGLTTEQIARAFLTPAPTIGQRISRAKRKIVSAGISLRVPEAEALSARLGDVLSVCALMYNEGYLTSTGPAMDDRALAADAIWLATLIAAAFPYEPEALGLLALMTLQDARREARTAGGRLVRLPEQDRSLYRAGDIARAVDLIERAAAVGGGRAGRFQLQAAIAAVHCEAPTWQDTDWLQIVILYDMLLHLDPSPVTALNRAIASAEVFGPERALLEVDALGIRLGSYAQWHATRAELMRRLGRDDDARDADRVALTLTSNPAEQVLLRERIVGNPSRVSDPQTRSEPEGRVD
jgi:RNA polymerase sigma factor (sigma-70 family)